MSPIIRVKDVIKILSISRSTLYKLISEGKFPKPFSLGARCVGWRRQQVLDWIDEQALKGQEV